MRIGVPFPLKTRSLLAAAGVLVPLLAALNVAAWFYGVYLPLGKIVAALGGLLDADWGASCPLWMGNAVLSAVILLVGLAVAGARASSTARRIVRLVDAAECFDDGRFDVPLQPGRGSLAALEKNMARLGRSLAAMLQFVNKNVANLAQKDLFPLSAESPEVTLAVFSLHNYHWLTRFIVPEQMNELVNEFLARIIPSITKTGGAVNKVWTIDDFYVLAVWGNASLVSSPKKDAVAALRTCVLVRSVVKTMNRDMRILGERAGYRRYPQFKVAMGVDSGEALVGPTGDHERKEHSILGDVVKNAVRCARIGAKTGTQIVMTEQTFELGGAHFVTQKMRGKNAAYFSLVKPVIGIGAENALP